MYAKLTFRNACRSIRDYALYLTTVTVLTIIIAFSNLLSGASNTVDGVQANSLPLIIALIMAILLHYINGFMLHRRGRELATYTLLGMNKRTISTMFFVETFLLGLVCFIIGTVLGSLVYFVIINLSASNTVHSDIWFYVQAAIASFLYFVGVQLVSGILSYVRISKLQISQLLVAGRKNEVTTKNSKPILWSVLFAVSFGVYLLLIFTITNITNKTIVMMSISMIFIPLLFSIFAFYKCFFLWLNWVRKNRQIYLYHNDRIYLVASILSKFKTDTRLYVVLSICLLFSAVCFIVGITMGYIPPNMLFSSEQTEWMSFNQVCLSITFIVIYFSILSVKHIINMQDNRHGLRLLGYLGKSKKQRQNLLLSQSCLNFTIPMIACVLTLSVSILPINSMLNMILPQANLIISAIAVFSLCFCVFYFTYLGVIYRLYQVERN